MLRYIAFASIFFYQIMAARLLNPSDMMVGADRDEFGCITSAGYSWCDYTQTCESIDELCMSDPSMLYGV
jgi:hypothetical protein